MWQQLEEAMMVVVGRGRGGSRASVVELGGSCRSEEACKMSPCAGTERYVLGRFQICEAYQNRLMNAAPLNG